MSTTERFPSYEDSPFARAQRDLAERAFGVRFSRAPVETWLPWRGHEVHVDDWPLAGARGTVILVHGAGGHGRLLAPFAVPLLEAGFAVRAPDLPGYGLTRVAEGARLDYAQWVDLVVDLADLAAARGPVLLYGLSVGGMTALWAAQRARAVAGVVATTLLDLRDPRLFALAARAPWIGRLALAAFRWLPRVVDRVALPLATLAPIEALTSDPALARVLRDDPLIGRRRVPAGFFRSMTAYRPTADDPRLPCPLLLAHPGADAWTPLALSLPAYERITSDKELVVLSNGAHAPLEAPAYGELASAVRRFANRCADARPAHAEARAPVG